MGQENLLSAGETQILQLAAQGLTREQISQQLGSKPRSVKDHLSHIQQKLGTKNRTESVLLAAQLNLLSLNQALAGLDPQRLNQLNPSEQKILASILPIDLTYHPTKEVASLLNLAPTTINNSRRNIFGKLGTPHLEQVALLRWAVLTGVELSVTNSPTEPSLPSLSPREAEVVKLLASGLTQKDIALHLGISEYSITRYTQLARRKYQVNSTAQLVLATINQGLFNPIELVSQISVNLICHLTKSERRVLEQMCQNNGQDCSVSRLAKLFNRSESTIQTHLSSILSKLDANTTLHACVIFLAYLAKANYPKNSIQL